MPSIIKLLIFSISGIIDLLNTFMKVNYARPYSITISDEEHTYLKSLIKTRTIQAQVADRARMLLWKSEAKTDKADVKGNPCQFKGGTIGTNIPLFR